MAIVKDTPERMAGTSLINPVRTRGGKLRRDRSGLNQTAPQVHAEAEAGYTLKQEPHARKTCIRFRRIVGELARGW